MKPLILYAEETENNYADSLICRRDISLAILRFANCLCFSEAHLERTRDIPTFVIDKKADFETECRRLRRFLDALGGEVACFYNDSEFNQEYIHRAARRLGLPGALTARQARTVRDKIAMKEFIRELGYDCVEYRAIRSFDEVQTCAEAWGFPLIIKWRTGVSSIEVYKIEDPRQLAALELDYASGKYMAEKFCPYKIWCVDAIISGGEVKNNLYVWLPYTNLDFAREKKRFAQIAVGRAPSWWKFSPKKLTQDVVSGLELENGYLHLEAFVTGEGYPIICEFAWRTTGDHVLSDYSRLYGTSIPDMLTSVLLKNPVAPLPDSDTCVADVFLPMRDGRVMSISDISELRACGYVLDGKIFYRPGDVMRSQSKYTDSSGWVQLKAAGIEEMMQKIDQIYSTFWLETEALE